MKILKSLVLMVCLITTVILSGCAGHKESLGQFDTQFENGLYEESTQLALKNQKSPLGNQDSGNLLWTLQAAASSRAASDYEASCKLFDQCEVIMKKHDEENALQDTAKYVSQLAVNDTILDYRSQVYDGIMVNTYKGLNFMAMGQMDDARIELNRADDRQRRAVEYFEKEIQARNEAIEKKKSENEKKGVFLDKALTSKDLQSTLKKKYPELGKWETYPDFVNPLTTYIQGLFLFLEGHDQQDMNKARDSFRRVLGMAPNKAVEEDLKAAEKILKAKTSRGDISPTVWVIFENGLCPVKDERRIDIPMFFEKVKYVGIALPSLKFRNSAYKSLLIDDGVTPLAQTSVLSSMDQVVQSEFKKEFPGIVTRSVLSAALKTYAQYEVGHQYGQLASLGAGLYQLATTQADIRNWSALPKEFQIARLKRPVNGTLRFTAPETGGGEIYSIQLPAKQFALVYVKIPTTGAPVVSHTITFGPELMVVAPQQSLKSALSKL